MGFLASVGGNLISVSQVCLEFRRAYLHPVDERGLGTFFGDLGVTSKERLPSAFEYAVIWVIFYLFMSMMCYTKPANYILNVKT